MQSRFTIIQGGLAQGRRHSAITDAIRAAGWRIAVRRPVHVDADEIAAWRALQARAVQPDPFADPDFLVTSAQHAPRIDGGVVFALAYTVARDGRERLTGVLPLQLPHPLWGGPTIRLWQPALAPHPVEPVFDDGAAASVIVAVLAHLRSVRPNTELALSGLAAEGASVRALGGDARFRIAQPLRLPAIPQAQFVAVGGRETAERTERVSAPEAMRDCVERFLLADARQARRPLLSDPAAAATVRVVTRLLARRGLVEVELGYAEGEPVSGTIRLGAAGERFVWRTVGLEPAPWRCGSADITVMPDAPMRDAAPTMQLRLVASRG